MLSILLGLLTYDTIKTVNKQFKDREKAEKRNQLIKKLQFRLRRPMTRTHPINCSCRLCNVRREKCITELNTLGTAKEGEENE